MVEHAATWRNLDSRSKTGWSVIRVLRRAPGFGFGYTVLCGFDNTKPAESRFATETRIAERFDVKRIDLVLEIVW
jgi:hypothetical protein